LHPIPIADVPRRCHGGMMGCIANTSGLGSDGVGFGNLHDGPPRVSLHPSSDIRNYSWWKPKESIGPNKSIGNRMIDPKI
jgi:hypothetical protein